jgi:hypothetical protein
LPPHERINLPSNSEDLVSIYGSNPQGELVEELEEVFYEEVGTLFFVCVVLTLVGLDVFH